MSARICLPAWNFCRIIEYLTWVVRCTVASLAPGGGALEWQNRLVHGLAKSTLITYFSGMKKDPKYVFLHAFFLVCQSCSFQNVSI